MKKNTYFTLAPTTQKNNSSSKEEKRDYPKEVDDIIKKIPTDPKEKATCGPEKRREFAVALTTRGKHYYQSKKPEEAKRDFDLATEIDKQYARPYYWRARLLDDKGDYENALKALNDAHTYGQKHSEAVLSAKEFKEWSDYASRLMNERDKQQKEKEEKNAFTSDEIEDVSQSGESVQTTPPKRKYSKLTLIKEATPPSSFSSSSSSSQTNFFTSITQDDDKKSSNKKRKTPDGKNNEKTGSNKKQKTENKKAEKQKTPLKLVTSEQLQTSFETASTSKQASETNNISSPPFSLPSLSFTPPSPSI